jgi:hypothetical protein
MKEQDEPTDIQINDPRFEYAVKEHLKLPLKTTGRVGVAAIKSIKELFLDNRGIKNLDGIQYFSSLTILSFSDNLVNEVDLSDLSQLKQLNCSSVYGDVNVKIECELSILICNIEQLDDLVKKPLRLKELTLKSNKPIDKLPDLVFELQNIEYLHASFLGLKYIRGIHQLKKLKTLDVSFNRILELNDDINGLDIKMLRIDKNPIQLLPSDMIKNYKLIIEMSYGYGELTNDGVCDEEWQESSYFICSRSISDEMLYDEFNDYGSFEIEIVHEWIEEDLITKITKDYKYEEPKIKIPPFELGIDGLPF